MAEAINPLFPTNFNMMVCGATRCGKTQFIKSILSCYELWERIPDRVVVAYEANPQQYKDIDNATLVHGLPDLKAFVENDRNELLIIDDATQLLQTANSDLLQLFTVFSHHANKSVIVVVHNPYASPFIRNLRLNSGFLVFFPNPVDSSYLTRFASQSYPNRTRVFTDAFQQATSGRPYSYLLYDARPETLQQHRLRTDITSVPQTLYKHA